MSPSFWKGKKVFLTGHTGFKGSWLSLWLQRLGANLTGYSLQPPSDPSLFEVAQISSGMVSLEGDVRDLDRLMKTLTEKKPEIVIHMAAQSLVRLSYTHPVETYATNVMGTINILEAVRHCKETKVVLVVTSDKCYENKERPQGYQEDEPMGGHDPYSNSKGCAELVTAAYRNSFFGEGPSHQKTAIASARAGNVLGGGDWGKDRLIPDILTSFMQQKQAFIRSPEAIRPWQYVLDLLNGYTTLIERLWEGGKKYTQGWNFGPDDEGVWPVKKIATALTNLWGQKAQWEFDKTPHPHEATLLKLDSSKARQQLGWLPKLPLATALEWTVEWYRAFKENKPMRQVTEEQIERFQLLS
ncbi:MAG: CDP-glucose 4,6-dehydratase [Deltaproteobacteria bacterium]|nr:CDP-glucose 4,6-dehydratase [Deltaproteobacteria bacterium]